MNYISFLIIFFCLQNSEAAQLDPTIHFEGKRFASPKSERNRNFSKPIAFLGLPGNKTLVSDQDSKSLQVFDKDWSLELQLKPQVAIQQVSSLCFGGENAVVALDSRAHRVLIFNSNGDQSKSFGSKGTNRKQLLYPRALSCEPNRSSLFISDTGNLRVQEWSLTGEVRKSFLYVNKETATLGAPASLAISNRKLAVIYPEIPAMVFFHKDSGRELATVDMSKLAASNDHLQLRAAPEGHWLLLNISRNELFILDSEGRSTHKLVAKQQLLSPLARLGYIDVDIYGSLRIRDDQSQRIWHIPARVEFQALQEARNHLRKGELTAALNQFKSVLELDPLNQEALKHCVDIYLILNAQATQEMDYEKAQDLLRELLLIQPSNKIAITRMRLQLMEEHRDWFTLIFTGLSLIFAALLMIPYLFKKHQINTQATAESDKPLNSESEETHS